MNLPLPEGSPPPEPQPNPSPRVSVAAMLSLGMGLLAVPLLCFAGLPALLFGYSSLYAINASEGQLRGRGLAIAGMVLGALGCLLGAGYGLFLTLGYVQGNSARARCADNLRQIGQALYAYQENHDHVFPQATLPNSKLPPEERLSWLAAILPFAERKAPARQKWQTLIESINPDKSWEDPVHQVDRTTNVRLFLCPGYPQDANRSRPGLTDYFGLAGIGEDSPLLPRDDPRAGFFGCDRTVTWSQVKQEQSTTLIVTETTRKNGPWIAGGYPTARGIDLEDTPLIGRDRQLGGCHFNFFTGEQGLNTLWLDGSVRYRTADIPAQLLADHVRINQLPAK